MLIIISRWPITVFVTYLRRGRYLLRFSAFADYASFLLARFLPPPGLNLTRASSRQPPVAGRPVFEQRTRVFPLPSRFNETAAPDDSTRFPASSRRYIAIDIKTPAFARFRRQYFCSLLHSLLHTFAFSISKAHIDEIDYIETSVLATLH